MTTALLISMFSFLSPKSAPMVPQAGWVYKNLTETVSLQTNLKCAVTLGPAFFLLFDISRLKNQNHLGIGQSILRAGATQCIPNLYSVHPYYYVLQNQTGSHHILSRFIPMSCGCLGLSKKSTKSTHLTCVTVLAQFYTTSTLKAHLFLWNLLKTRTQM